MLVWADRVRMAGALGAIHALSACAGGVDDRELGAVAEPLNDGAWSVADVGDFNGDGLADVLWDDTGKSKMAVWLMSGTDVLLPGAPVPGPPGATWSAIWASDFNADGMVDARWYNYANNESAIWLMKGTKLLLPGPVFPGPAGAGWARVTAIDFNRDGMADLLWRDSSSGEAEVWLMGGTKPILLGSPIPAPTGDGWVAGTAGDFDADGSGDILWYNPVSRSMSVTLIDATAPLVQGPEMPAPGGAGVWGPITTADFNSDGMADVLWFNATTQRMAIWLMAGTALLAPGPELPAPPGGGWRTVTVGDFNGDGLADVIWENVSTHRFAVWLMAGTDVLLAGPELPAPGGP